MRRIVLLNGSPKPVDKSVSLFLCKRFAEREAGRADCVVIHTRDSFLSGTPEHDFEQMAKADALVIIFPLYFFCVPALLDQFLVDYAVYLRNNNRTVAHKVYAVINCGFPEPGINAEAAEVVKSFARQVNAPYRFAILAGGGGMLDQDASPAKKALAKVEQGFDRMVDDTCGRSQNTQTLFVEIPFPRRLYFFMGNLGWRLMAKKNGLKFKNLRRRPYIM